MSKPVNSHLVASCEMESHLGFKESDRVHCRGGGKKRNTGESPQLHGSQVGAISETSRFPSAPIPDPSLSLGIQSVFYILCEDPEDTVTWLFVPFRGPPL